MANGQLTRLSAALHDESLRLLIIFYVPLHQSSKITQSDGCLIIRMLYESFNMVVKSLICRMVH